MGQSKFNRRDFLVVCLLTGAGAGLAACEGKVASLIPTLPTLPTFSPTSPPPGRIYFSRGDGDAWSWKKVIKGSFSNFPDCQAVTLEVNGNEIKAELAASSSVENSFTASIPLTEGLNRIQAVCLGSDGEEGKSEMGYYEEKLRYVPKAVINLSINDEIIFLDSGESQAAGDSVPKIIDRLWSARTENPAALVMLDEEGLPSGELTTSLSADHLRLASPSTDGEYYISLTVKDENGREDSSSGYFIVEAGVARIPDYDREHPDWVENAIVYGVIPRKFGTPAFKAISGRLDELQDLGVTALWLAPIFISPPGDYGYAVKDYFELNPEYGSKEDFHRMVQEAHAHGIRVLMDFVPNHSSDQHPYFIDAQSKGQASNYWEFYARDGDGNPTHYFNWTYLPNLNYSNPEVNNWITEAFSYWVREFDVDGFRVDAAWGVKERCPEYWPAWRRELKRIKPDLFLLAEASARDPYYFDNGFDVAYDWTDQLGKWAWGQVWDSYKNRLLPYNLDVALTNRPTGYHPDAVIFRFLNNNDTGDRFITQHGEGMALVSTALLLTLPGIPCIYTGDELGEEFSPYENEEPLQWKERYPGLRNYHKSLIALRKTTPGLHSRLWTRVEFAAIPQPVFGYIRYTAPQNDPVLVLLNFSEEAAELAFGLPPEFTSMRSKGVLNDLLTGEKVSVASSGPLKLSLPPFGVKILSA